MDQRTKDNIATLHPDAQPWAVAFINLIDRSNVLPAGYLVKIISGNRTWAEQDELYAKGRTTKGSKVTNAKGGQSNHNFGVAWDIGIFTNNGKTYLTDSPYYSKIGPIGRAMGLEWGGDWRSFRDTPHYQVKVGLSMAQMRDIIRRGHSIPVPKYAPQTVLSPGGGNNLRKVTILEHEVATTIPAYFDSGRVWVAVRPFVDRFGGEIESVSTSDKKFRLTLNEQSVTLSGVIKQGVGYVKFADINAVLEWAYKFYGTELKIYTSID